jgi:hypothetical protein
MKSACMSNVKDPENRSKKDCVCGGHSTKNKNCKKNKFEIRKSRKFINDIKNIF